MKVLVVGGSRGTGAAVATELAERGHLVTAYARSASGDGQGNEKVRYVEGDVLDREELGKAMIGQDAVVVTLGISDNPFRVRLTRRATSPLDIRSRGTREVIRAMRDHGVQRLVVQSTYGIGETYAQLPLALKLFFTLAIRPQVDDHERQERLVRESDLSWTIMRPVVLNDEPATLPAHVGTNDRVKSMKVARRQVAEVTADALETEEFAGHVLSVSAAAAASVSGLCSSPCLVGGLGDRRRERVRARRPRGAARRSSRSAMVPCLVASATCAPRHLQYAASCGLESCPTRAVAARPQLQRGPTRQARALRLPGRPEGRDVGGGGRQERVDGGARLELGQIPQVGGSPSGPPGDRARAGRPRPARPARSSVRVVRPPAC